MVYFLLLSQILFIFIGRLNGEEDNKARHPAEILEMPGATFPINFKQYSGFLKVSDTHFYHYWFMESQSAPKTDPLIINTASGPGCSAMLSTYTAPFYVNSDGKTLRHNPYGLNKNASVLILDGPAGVGFSYTTDGNYKSDDNLTASEYYVAVKQFFVKFPEFRHHPTTLRGGSYGGIYIPLLAAKILEGNKKYPIDLKGIMISNGELASINSITSMVEYGYMHGQVDEKWWGMIQRNCCDGNDYVCWDGIMENENKVLEDGETCGLKIWNMYTALWNTGVDPYDISSTCQDGESTTAGVKEGANRQEEMLRFVPERIWKRFGKHLNHQKIHKKGNKNGLNEPKSSHHKNAAECDHAANSTKCGFKKIISRALTKMSKNKSKNKNFQEPFIPMDECTMVADKTAYFNREEVQKALNIPPSNGAYSVVPTHRNIVEWVSCWDSSLVDYGYLHDDMSPEIKTVLDANLPVLLFYGDQDMYVNFVNAQRLPERLKLNLTTPKEPYKFGEQTAGFKTIYEDGAFQMLTVRLAGHNVPAARPDVSDYIISQFMQNKNI